MDGPERHRLILDGLRNTGRVDVAELAWKTATSVVTIRRDLDQLARLGALRRVRGGAVAAGLRGEGMPFAARTADHSPVKARLAAAVGELIADGEAVGIDSGTTAEAVAHVLATRRVTAVPMSTQAIAALTSSVTATVVVPGGTVNPAEGSLGGPLLEATFSRIRLDTAVLSCCGAATSAGVTAFDLTDAAAKQAMLGAANRSVLVLDASKFAVSAMAVVCGLEDLDVVVTERSAPASVLDSLREAGVELVLV